ncbi:MAG: phosphate ABC transporter substrate-binding protein [bacterium]|nr:phosphate ABC transporter substrate-binding protein [bacterium]
MKSIRKYVSVVAIFVCLPLVVGFVHQKRVTIKGSDTMVILTQRWAEVFPHKNGVEFQVTGGGSGTGIAALINGTTDICASSRPIKSSEVQQLKAKFGYKGMEIRVARDGINLYVHKSNRVRKLTVEQIRLIFTGKVQNWKDVGGADKKIILYSRENNSGTYEFFKEHVLLKQDFTAEAQHMAGTAALINAVSKDPAGIGFGGAAYASNVAALSVAADAKSAYITPSENTVLNGQYPVSRFLYFYTNQRPKGTVKKFIDWVISPAGQKVVKNVGYYPIKAL